MAINSTRSEIIKILCDKSIFPIGYEGYSWDYAEKIKKYLPASVISSVKDINNSIREVLETVDGYTFSNGTVCFPKMNMQKTKVARSGKPNKYYVWYKVI